MLRPFIAVLIALPAFAQHDVSLWSRNTTVIPWYLYTGKRVVVDARYNFDALKTAGVCLGKSFGTESVTFIPEACGYAGKMNGYGPELLIMGARGKNSFFTQNQYLHGIGNAGYGYHWFDYQRSLVKWLSVGFGEQVFKETEMPAPRRGSSEFDIGPSAKLTFGGVYFKSWLAWSAGPMNKGSGYVFLGLGYTR